jgi:hypothetical protein
MSVSTDSRRIFCLQQQKDTQKTPLLLQASSGFNLATLGLG